MREFKSFNEAFKWVDRTLEETSKKALPIITEQVYKDSDKYTYRETGQMYDSGAVYSQFDKGILEMRAPQVRKLYYDPNITPRLNKQAVPMWFLVAAKQNMNTYKKQYARVLEQAKRGV